MALKCEIQWVDDAGNKTPDDNPAVGFAYVVEHDQIVAGRKLHYEESAHYPICAEHAKRLSEPGMGYWRFVELAK